MRKIILEFKIKKKTLEQIKRNFSNYFIISFQFLLFFSGVLIYQNKLMMSEYVGNIAFYFLIIGFLLKMYDNMTMK